MADAFPAFDTSSYPKPTAGPSALDTFGKLQGLEQQKLGIDKQKLDLANAGFDRLLQSVNALNPITATPDDAFKVGQNLVNMKIFTPEAFGQFVKSVPNSKEEMPKWLEWMRSHTRTAQEMVNWSYGQQGTASDNTSVYQTRSSPNPAIGVQINPKPIITNKLPVEIQVPDTDPQSPTYGQPRFNAPASGPVVIPPQQQQPQQSRQQSGLPVSPPTFNNNFPGGDPGSGTRTPNQVVQNSFGGPQGPASTMPPLYSQGQKEFNEDRELATKRLTAVKPALQALDLMKGLRSGPGTQTWNQAVAFGKANGILPITANDPTAIYQEVNKYLNAYMQGNGTRSDADLAQREVSSPNITQQISPALEKLTRTQIARDRIEAARANAFYNLDENGKPRLRNDFDKYGEHRSKFPPKMDETAFIVDRMDDKERQKLFEDMLKKKDTKEGKKFWQSLEVAKHSGVF